MSPDFYKTKSLLEMSDEEWEAVCDGCGKCCFRKFIDGRGKNTKLYYTCIACDNLNLETGLCNDYADRFKNNPECTHLTKKNVKEFSWLPETCAYRLLSEKKPLPEWHPLVSGISLSENPDKAVQTEARISGGIHESDVEDWEDYILSEEPYSEK